MLLVCAGCASKPASISLAVVDDVSLTQARDDGDAYLGSTVRWGGVVTEVENKADKTWVFLVGRALKDNEKPIIDGQSEGRFIASFDGFIDPLVYKSGRPLTVVGDIEGSTVRSIARLLPAAALLVLRHALLSSISLSSQALVTTAG
jgi:outer membrane lipoprotein